MTKEEQVFNDMGQSMKDTEASQMFGKPCFKIKGKAFACFFEKCMVFKLTGKIHEEAMALDGSKLFDPSGKKRPMKEWVQVPYDYQDQWKKFTKAAFDYVKKSA